MVESDKQFTLLLVDDNPTNLLLLTKIIELDLPEVRVLTATSAMEGLKLSEQDQINGVFVDVQMPQMSGLDMCRRLNENPRTSGIPLVLMTAHLATPEMRAEGLEVGAYDFISQPISNIEMLARIKVMLRLCANEQRSLQNNNDLQQQVEDHATRLRWVSGLLISGDGPLAEPDQQLLEHLVAVLPAPGALEDQLLFDRLTTDFPLPWRRTLLKISLLDTVPVRLASELSEINNIEAVFDYLHRHELSLIQSLNGEDFLLFKPETKTFLRKKAEQELDEKERQQVYLVAADWFQKQDDLVAALHCLISAEYYSAVAQLLSQFGLALFDKHPQSEILPLFTEISEDICSTCGWLALFRGLHLFSQRRPETVVWLEIAYQRFQDDENSRGQLLTLSQQVFLSLYLDGCFERWATRLAPLRQLAMAQIPVLETTERLKVSYALGMAELFFAGRLAAVEELLEGPLAEAQQRQLVIPQMELNLLRALLGLHQGRYLVARSALEQGLQFAQGIAVTIEHTVLQVVACEILYALGDLHGFQQQLQMIQQSSSPGFGQTVFAPLLNYYEASLFLARGDHQHALELIEVARSERTSAANSHMESRLLQLRGYCRALAGEEVEAVADLEEALRLRQMAGGVFQRLENLLFAGLTCSALGRCEQAASYFSEGLTESLATKEERYSAGFYAWSAVAAEALGKPETADIYLRNFFELLNRQKINYCSGLTPALLKQLATKVREKKNQALLQPLMAEYLQMTFGAENQLVPLLRIHSLGGFRLQLEADLFDFRQVGQASRQIFALLIVTPNHAMSLEQIMGLLWPESPANRARNSFDTAHSRLRKALEESFGQQVRQHYLVLEKGMLALRHIQIDQTLMFELMTKARYHWQRGNDWQAEQALWKVEELWHGEFLAGFNLIDELLSRAEQLNQLRLEQLELLAQLLQKRQQYAGAIKILHQGLLLDPTRDAMVRRLLSVYRDQQDNRSAGILLEKYRTALKKEEYEEQEIAELIEALGAHWLTHRQ